MNANGGVRDLTGSVFDRLTVLARDGHIGKKVAWRVRCSCGTEKTVTSTTLVSKKARSCGCLRAEILPECGRKTAAANSKKGAARGAASRTRHGHATRKRRSRTYMSWDCMMQRCYNPNTRRYDRYGGAGVLVCERWHTYDNFLADMGERPVGRSIDRMNPFGNYEPDNCRWATPKEQSNNQRRHHAK